MVNPSGAAGAAIVQSADAAEGRSYVDWPAVIAGAVFASAISFVLFAFGSAVGLGILSPYSGEGAPGLAVVLLSGVWVIFVAVSSFMSGAYLCGRMRRRFYDASEAESTLRDGAHGLIVWGLAVLIGAFIATASIAGAARGGAAIAAGAASGAATAAAGQGEGGTFDLITDALFRPGANPPAQAQAEGGPSRGEVRDEVDRMLARGLVRGEIAAPDRSYIAQLVSRETGMPQAEAEARVNSTLDTAIAEAQRAADVARKIGVLIAFLTAATLLIAGAASYWAAARGGDHRDNNTDLGPLFR